MGIQYREVTGMDDPNEKEKPVVVCSMGDGSITEGEVAEAFQMAVLKMPILYFIQDNEGYFCKCKRNQSDGCSWLREGIQRDGSSFHRWNWFQSVLWNCEGSIGNYPEGAPSFMIHAKVPLLGHHTSGVRREWYRDDLEEHKQRDPLPKFYKSLLNAGFTEIELKILKKKRKFCSRWFQKAMKSEDPRPEDLFNYDFAPRR